MKKYTVYISSNKAGNTKSVSVSQSALHSLLALSIILSLLFVCIVFDYIDLVINRTQFVKVKANYHFLLNNLQYVESELTSLESQLKKVNNLTTKIEVIQDYYSKGPISAISTPTEYFSVDYVATGESRKISSLRNNKVELALLTRKSNFLPTPVLGNNLYPKKLTVDKMSDRIGLAAQNTQILERKVMQLWENLSERQNFIRATPSISPARGWFSSRFGIRADPFSGRPTMHSGLDIAARYGTPVHSTADGIVTYVGYQNGYGNIVSIDHGYGIQTRYAHNSKVYVKRGQKIRRYDVISAIGNSGRSTGSHLHYEVRVRGIAVDPINYVLDF